MLCVLVGRRFLQLGPSSIGLEEQRLRFMQITKLSTRTAAPKRCEARHAQERAVSACLVFVVQV